MNSAHPNRIEDIAHLEQLLSEPDPGVVDTLGRLDGDIIVLGVAGKMGPTLARMAKRASDEAGVSRRVIGVSRFSAPGSEDALKAHGVETIACDLLDREALHALPGAPNVVYMAGMKFGSTGNEALTWAMNTYLPGMVCERYATSRIVAFSTGNVYGLAPVVRGGQTEDAPLNPDGDYATSCAGRERMIEHFSRAHGTPAAIIRLNYATEMRYGVLVDLAQQVWNGQPVNLAMGAMNVIWQRDANAMTLRSFDHAASPPFVLNVAGPELLSVRQVCTRFGELMGREARFEGEEASDALLSNGQKGHRMFGYPSVPAGVLLEWTADWVMRGGDLLGKPTHFEARDGKF